jgi:cell division protein FtsW
VQDNNRKNKGRRTSVWENALSRFRANSYEASRVRGVRVDAGVDRVMLIIILVLLCLGSIMVFSASYADALSRYGDSYYYIKRQMISVALGLVVFAAMQKIDFSYFRYLPFLMYPVTVLMLIAVLIKGTADGVAKRWIYIGPMSFQPSELAKLTLVVTLAWYMSYYREKITDYKHKRISFMYGVFYPMILLGIICVLVLLENHLSGVVILGLIGIVMMFLGGTQIFWLGLFGGIATAGLACFALFTNYTKARIDAWFHPENYALEGGWQTLQGFSAIGSGGLFGLGLGGSRQKYSYVSEPQNDFIFTIWCEEMGFIGAVALVALFAVFVWRGYVIAMRAPDMFSSLVVFGIVSRIAIQVILNIGVVTGLLPNTGIALPFFSYGGSSVMILMVEMGMVLAISRCSGERR